MKNFIRMKRENNRLYVLLYDGGKRSHGLLGIQVNLSSDGELQFFLLGEIGGENH